MKYRYELIQDQDPTDPRGCDNLGTMACWHRRYILGDEQPSCGFEDYLIDLCDAKNPGFRERLENRFSTYYENQADREEQSRQYRAAIENEFDRHYLSLPLYLYDHGGITISCAAFSCPWDSMTVGLIYISKADALRECFPGSAKIMTTKRRKKVYEMLTAEVDEYNKYLTGDCWGYEIYEMDDDPDMIAAGYEDDGHCVDSCWDFMGYEWAEQAAQEAMTYYVQKDAENPQQAVLFPDGNETAHIRAAYA